MKARITGSLTSFVTIIIINIDIIIINIIKNVSLFIGSGPKEQPFLGEIHCCTRLKESMRESVHLLLKGPWTA